MELNDLHLGTCLWGSKARRVTSIITSTVLCKREFFTLLASAGCGGIFPLLSQWTVIVPGIKDGDVPVVNLLSQVTCKSQAWLYLCKAETNNPKFLTGGNDFTYFLEDFLFSFNQFMPELIVQQSTFNSNILSCGQPSLTLGD